LKEQYKQEADMKKTSILIVLLLWLPLGIGGVPLQSGYDLFQKALMLDRVDGMLQEAIALYQKIVDQSKDQALAAQAQLHIGICHQKLGNKEAQSAFQKVIQNYPGQAEVVAQARSLLEALRSDVPGSEPTLTTRLVSSKADLWGAVSPDGRFHAHADWETSTGEVAVRDLVNGQTRTITKDARDTGTAPEFVQNLIFSPDSSKIAYSWLNDKEFYELRIISRDGGPARVLYRDAGTSSIIPADWSQDGRYILATVGQYIVRVSVADGKMERIRALGQQHKNDGRQKMAFSPDGRFIVYDHPQAEGTASRDIFVLSSDGKRNETLIQHPANDVVLGWSPDGRYILFSSDRTGSRGAWRVPVSDGRPTGPAVLIKGDIGEVRSFGFSSNGSFYYGTGGWTTDICQVVVDPETMTAAEGPRPLVQRHMGSNSIASWSPDGKQLAYLSIRGKPHPIFICIGSGEFEKEIQLTPKMTPYGQLLWYADSKSLLLGGMDENGRPGLFRIEPEGSTAVNLLEFKTRPLSAVLSRISDTFLCIVNDWENSISTIMMRNLRSGEEKQVCQLEKKNAAFSGLALSPDETTLATVIWGEDNASLRLVKVSIKDGTQTDLMKVPPTGMTVAINNLTWTPDGRNILFVRSPSGPPAGQVKELWAIPSNGGEPHRVGVRARTIPSVDIHPDGRRIVLTLGEYKANLWVMQNVLPGRR
jgi:Tol biopolymer transport system component